MTTAENRPARFPQRVTTFELLLDLVLVFAVIQVVSLAQAQGIGLARAAVLLALIWLCWLTYAWLGNLTHADRGASRLAFVVAMAALFAMSVMVPRTFEGGRTAALVFLMGFAAALATGSAATILTSSLPRRVVVSTIAGQGALVVLLVCGVVAGPSYRILWWAAAALVGLVALTVQPDARWQVASPAHLAERFGLVILIALGENLAETGTRATQDDLTWFLALALTAVLILIVGMWWVYFDAFTRVGEEMLQRLSDERRARLARDGFAYLHLLMVGGIVAAAAGTALSIVQGTTRAGEGRWLLDGGVASYLAALNLFRIRTFGSTHVPRAIAVLVLLAGSFGAGHLISGHAALGELCWAALVVAALVAYETVAYRNWRRRVRASDEDTPLEPMTRA